MKKLLTATLALCLLLTLCASLSACMHKCEFSTEWTWDETSHWHACIGEDCPEIADKADHTWDEGKITTAATQDADGVKTYTCTVCGNTKTEAVAFTGMSETAWKAALSDSAFKNFIYKESASTNGSGVSVDTSIIYKFTEDNAWMEMVVAGQTQSEFAPDKASANEARKLMVDSIKDLAPYSSYAYDAQTKTYKATKEIKVASLNASTKDITLKFEGEHLVEIKYSISFAQNSIVFTAESTITLSDYGTVTLDPSAK